MANASIDQNFTRTLLAVSSTDGTTPVTLYADPTTHRLLVDLADISSHFKTDQYTSTASQVQFTASQTPLQTEYVTVNGLIQTPTTDYSISGSTLTLASGIPAGCSVLWRYIY
jgi:hypothetical protein